MKAFFVENNRQILLQVEVEKNRQILLLELPWSRENCIVNVAHYLILNIYKSFEMNVLESHGI